MEIGEPRTAEALIRDMARLQAHHCPACSTRVCSHQVLMNLVLGFKDSPRCLDCLAAALDRDPGPLRDQLIDYLQQRECHQDAWAWANHNEGVSPNAMPPCLATRSRKSSAKTPEVRGKRTGMDSSSAFSPQEGNGRAMVSPHNA